MFQKIAPAFILSIILFSSCKKDKTPPPEDILSAGWTKKAINTGKSVDDVYFINNNTGFAVSSQSIFKTTNGGTDWQKVYETSGSYFSNIGMSSENHGVFMGSNGDIFVTKNGGQSFDSIQLTGNNITDVYCVDANIVYIIGQNVWKSNDGGTTWAKGFQFNSFTRYNSIQFLNEQTGWVIGSGGLYKTINGGLSWDSINTTGSYAHGSSVASLFFTDSNRGYIADNTKISKTSNGGVSWNLVYTASSAYHDVQLINDNLGYIADGQYLLKTTDGGSTWQKVVTLGADSFIELHFTDANHGWAGTAGGAVLRYQQ
jgi:photosystem II stability/assembly factor-like uncharacterized protein